MSDTIGTKIITKNTKQRDWSDAIELFLSSRKSEATGRAYGAALRDLLATSGKRPWEITRTDIIRWTRSMQERGMSPATIAQRLAGVSSFFAFCMTEYVLDDSEQSLLHSQNPVAGKSLRPTVEMYGKATWLDKDEARALLEAINLATLQGKRDYALILGYVLLARRNTEWRRACWGDFESYGSQVIYRWGGKGKTDQRLDIPAPLWAAVCQFLQAAGRLEDAAPGDYVFTAMTTGRKMPGGRVVEPNMPISAHEVGRLLKRYLLLAGLQAKHIRPHSLRHTGAMLMREAGASDQEIMEYLGQSNLAVTQVYLHALAGHKNDHWQTVSEMLGLFSGGKS
jgi:integrase/recombinase XerD